MLGESGNDIDKPEVMTAEEWYLLGNEYRRQSDWKQAIDCYMEAISRDADSPAVEAKEMLDNILNYYNKDVYNP